MLQTAKKSIKAEPEENYLIHNSLLIFMSFFSSKSVRIKLTALLVEMQL